MRNTSFVTLVFCAFTILFQSSVLHADSERVPGITRPVYDGQLSTRLAGTVYKVHVRIGDAVKAGDVLIQFVDRREQIVLRSTRAVLEDKSELNAAVHRLALLSKELKSLTELSKNTGSVSQDQLDAITLEKQLGEANKALLEVREEKENLDLKLAMEEIDLLKLKAPKDGIVTGVAVEDGEFASPDVPVIRLVNIDECYFECSLTIQQSGGLKMNQECKVELNTPDGKMLTTAKVIYVAPIVDPASGLKEIRLLIKNPDHSISPGVSGALLLSK